MYEPVWFFENLKGYRASQEALAVKKKKKKKNTNLPMQEKQEMRVPAPGWEDPLEEGVATRSSARAWRIQRTEEPGGYEGTHPRLV